MLRSLKLWSSRAENCVCDSPNGNCPLALVKSWIVRGYAAAVVVSAPRNPAASWANGWTPLRKLSSEFCDAVGWKILGSLSRLTKEVRVWLRRSTAVKKNVLSWRSGPPNEPPYCCRLKGDWPLGLKSKALRASKALSRKRPNALPKKLLRPDFETMLTTPPEAPPNSGL